MCTNYFLGLSPAALGFLIIILSTYGLTKHANVFYITDKKSQNPLMDNTYLSLKILRRPEVVVQYAWASNTGWIFSSSASGEGGSLQGLSSFPGNYWGMAFACLVSIKQPHGVGTGVFGVSLADAA